MSSTSNIFSFNKIFFILIACFFLINAIMIGIEEKDIFAGISDIGNKLIYSTKQLSDASIEIYQNGFIIDKTKTIFSNAKTYWNLISSLLGVLLWIRIFTWLVNSVLKLPVFFNILVGLLIFITIQMIVLLMLLDGDKMAIVSTPITCIWHFIKIIPILINPFRQTINNFLN